MTQQECAQRERLISVLKDIAEALAANTAAIETQNKMMLQDEMTEIDEKIGPLVFLDPKTGRPRQ